MPPLVEGDDPHRIAQFTGKTRERTPVREVPVQSQQRTARATEVEKG
ncbi:hypothetical protein SCMC78_36000 [Streptomyces sp. CMC78]|uniref:Uncharacterized protein n=1 Tax=Streptomyces sp. CMC78 TaxID=3231512 RepID=A0AB33KPQ8_9ACTN